MKLEPFSTFFVEEAQQEIENTRNKRDLIITLSIVIPAVGYMVWQFIR